MDPETVADGVRDDTAIVSVMMANNEIGTLQPTAEIGWACRIGEAPFHVDGAQAVGEVPVDSGGTDGLLPLDWIEGMNDDLTHHEWTGDPNIQAISTGSLRGLSGHRAQDMVMAGE